MKKDLIFYYKEVDFSGAKYIHEIDENAFNAKIEKIDQTFENVKGYGDAPLKKVVISFKEDLTAIGSNAIQMLKNGEVDEYHSINILELPDTVKSIEADSFNVFDLKTNLYDENGDLIVNGKLIRKICDPNSAELVIPEGVVEIPEKAKLEDLNLDLKKIILPSTLKKIGSFIFGHTDIKSIKLPKELEEIGERTFAYCKLNSLTIPSTVKKIGSEAFACNNTLKKVTLPADLEIDFEDVFKHCKKLTEVIRK